MAIRAVVFDIGGVLEITPRTGWDTQWEARLGLPPGELTAWLRDVWRGGDVGTLSEAEVEAQTAARLGQDEAQVAAFMTDLWDEYCGTLNTELATYFTRLRPRYRSGILSNSFVGAREHEQARYGFGDMCDYIVYSHEVGMKKPDPRIYALTRERQDVHPHVRVFVDEHEEALVPARALGVHGILFQTTAQTIADVETCLAADEQQP
jgi:epoxide hydrolase-like predicted phosphatase